MKLLILIILLVLYFEGNLLVIYILTKFDYSLFSVHCNVYCEHGSLELVNGSSNNQGRLEICINFVWGTVCDNPYYSHTNNAKVVCRQLGYEVDGGQSENKYIIPT